MKITIDKDVLERVLNAILNAVPQTASQAKEQLESLLVLRGALAQPHLEPVGEVTDALGNAFKCEFKGPLSVGTKLYTSPPARKPLTDERLWKIWNSQGDDAMDQQAAITFARAVEAAHGIKEAS